MTNAIELRQVTKYFGGRCAVHEVTLDVPRGEIFGFLGPNGAGKTTIIKLMCGLLRPSAGTVRVLGEDPVAPDATVRRRIAYIPDSPYIYERLTAAEFFDFVGQLYGVPADQTARQREEWFDRFELTEAADMLIRDFSHGMRQRLIYASALLREPEIFFVDEPFIGLDPKGIRLIKTLLRERARAGATVFLTTHLLALIETLADRVGILRHGRLMACAPIATLRTLSRGTGSLEDIYLDLTGADHEPVV